MRGWIYVITNQAMPGLVKVGYSTKDPILRAKGLGHTGTPHRYVVAYDALVHEPRDAEARVHEALSAAREGKEWFKCSVQNAIATIRSTLEGNVLLECKYIGDIPEQHASAADKNLSGIEGRLTAEMGERRRVRTTGTFSGRCAHCKFPFSVTLTRGDDTTRCPECCRETPVSTFLESRLYL